MTTSPSCIQAPTIISMEELLEMTVTALKKMAQEYKIKDWWKIKKAELIKAIWSILPLSMKPKPTAKEQQHLDLSSQIEEFTAQGGEVTQCKPQKNPKRVPPTMASAEKNNISGKKIKAKKITDDTPRKSRVKRVREDENIITLQSIINEIGLPGALARKALRAARIEKPGKQWCWGKDSKELEKIKELMSLTAGIGQSIRKCRKKAM